MICYELHLLGKYVNNEERHKRKYNMGVNIQKKYGVISVVQQLSSFKTPIIEKVSEINSKAGKNPNSTLENSSPEAYA